MSTVLVTGANGFIGSALMRHFAERGWHTIGAGRHEPPVLPQSAQWRAYDLSWTELPTGFFDGADVAIHAAMIRNDYAVNVAGSTLLMREAQHAGVDRIVFLSSLAAHASALSQYGRQKYALECLFAEHGGLVIRPGLVLGDGGSFGAMRAHVRRHRVVPLIDGGMQPLQTVEIGELVSKIFDAVERRLRGTFTIASEPMPYRAFYASIAAQLGVRPAFVPVPFWVADLAIRIATLLHVRLPIDRDNLLGLHAMRADTGLRL